MDVDLNTQLQMVQDRFIDGQADRSLRRHLASLKPNIPMIEMVDSCRIWERHCEPEIRPRMGTNKGPVQLAGQVDRHRRFPQRLSPWKQWSENYCQRRRPLLYRRLRKIRTGTFLLGNWWRWSPHQRWWHRNAVQRTMWKRRYSVGPQREQSRRGTPRRGVFHAERGHIIRRNVRL